MQLLFLSFINNNKSKTFKCVNRADICIRQDVYTANMLSGSLRVRMLQILSKSWISNINITVCDLDTRVVCFI